MYSLVKRHNRFGKSDARKMACGGLEIKQEILQTEEKDVSQINRLNIGSQTSYSKSK